MCASPPPNFFDGGFIYERATSCSSPLSSTCPCRSRRTISSPRWLCRAQGAPPRWSKDISSGSPVELNCSRPAAAERADAGPNESGARRRNRRTIGPSGRENIGAAEFLPVPFGKDKIVTVFGDECEAERATDATLSILRFHRLVAAIVDLIAVVMGRRGVVRAATFLLMMG